ncbi:MAG: NADH-quinone oxidoreductase subunit J [Candidatus Micrarchaeota archaeon]|nr:NADH-quinone oxidoreductase subunit J [Candidatus Micrarchaeota archaeon]MDE1833879.1 NADH-quinone oxidoreductase subunit J [Candidatus Micrarchaeota archaeon]MDE1859366.1 NADH-quinone oxidoreductase subunit J [Candidatus Micrarchaeota archaeon]
MLDTYVFYAIAAAAVVSSILIFVERKLIHAVLALTSVFISSALLFLLLGQTFISMLVLIVFVGGLSTYLIVAVATEEKNMKLINLPMFIAVSIILFAGLSVLISYLPQNSQQGTPNFLSTAVSAFSSSAGTLYIVVIMMFAITLAGTLIIKKFTRLIV